MEGSFVKQNVLQRRVSKLLNEPPYGRQNQTNRRHMFRKTSAVKLTNLCDDSYSVEIAFLFIFQMFEARTRANQANITGLGTINL